MSLTDVAKLLTSIHDEIRRGLEQLERILAAGSDAAVAADFAKEIPFYLHEHHEAEDRFLFPAVKRGVSMKPDLVAFLDARTDEHGAIHALSDALARAAATLDREAIRQASVALRAQLDPHFLAEERGLSASELTDPFDDGAVVAAERRIRAHMTPDSFAHNERFLHHPAWLTPP